MHKLQCIREIIYLHFLKIKEISYKQRVLGFRERAGSGGETLAAKPDDLADSKIHKLGELTVSSFPDFHTWTVICPPHTQ